MTEEQIALARRAVACKGWRWMPGMRATEGMRVIHEPRLWPDRPSAIREGSWVDTAVPRRLFSDHLPDLTDPATLGCLLALVREAGGDSEMHMALGAKGWVWLTGESRAYDVVMPINAGETEAEALVAALEAAP